jgi:hypothetical protein
LKRKEKLLILNPYSCHNFFLSFIPFHLHLLSYFLLLNKLLKIWLYTSGSTVESTEISAQ